MSFNLRGGGGVKNPEATQQKPSSYISLILFLVVQRLPKLASFSSPDSSLIPAAVVVVAAAAAAVCGACEHTAVVDDLVVVAAVAVVLTAVLAVA